MGECIAIGDSWLSHSCFGYLKRFKIDKLKIDQRLAQELSSEVNNRIIITTIISMAKHLRMEMLAEGVERSRWRLLRENNPYVMFGAVVTPRDVLAHATT